jgi:hypothetical protein
MMRTIPLVSLLQIALIITPILGSPQPTGGDVVILRIRVDGLPPNVSSRVYLNGTSSWLDGRQLTVNSSGPLTIELRRGSTVTVALDLQISDSLGNIYTLSWIEYGGNRYRVVTLKVDQDVELFASYNWSHLLLHPLLWPFYALLILLFLHRWLRSLYGKSAEK